MKSTKKTLVASALTMLAFLGVAAGTTYAILSDQTTHSIAVKAGKVDIGTTLVVASGHSEIDTDAYQFVQDTTDTNLWVNAKTGGTVKVESDGTITLERLVPGDTINLTYTVRNFSTVGTQWRLRYSDTHASTAVDLYPALDIQYWASSTQYTFDANRKGAWAHADPNQSSEGDILWQGNISIYFKNTDYVITPRDTGSDNPYQEASCTIAPIAEIVQEGVDMSKVDSAN